MLNVGFVALNSMLCGHWMENGSMWLALFHGFVAGVNGAVIGGIVRDMERRKW
jgi:hypothetical protein